MKNKQNKIIEDTTPITEQDIVEMAKRCAQIKHNIAALESKLGVFKKATSECVSTLREEMDRLLRQIRQGEVELYQNDFEEERSRIVQAKRPMGVLVIRKVDTDGFEVQFGGHDGSN